MKRIILAILLLKCSFIYSQSNCDSYCLDFDGSLCINQLKIDSPTATVNLWKIGQPNKPQFVNAVSGTKVIITDTINPYPINNYSSFTITNTATMGDIYGLRIFQGVYFVQSDSLNDYGRMEFSPDLGVTWIDMIEDTVYNAFNWFTLKPVLTGNSLVWKYFDVLFVDIGSIWNVQLGDTLMYRFTFKSDSIVESLGGLMYDDFCFNDFVEGVTETRFKPIKSRIYPNPSANFFTIKFDNPSSEIFELAVYNIKSQLMLTKENIKENKISFDTKNLKPGTYIYKLTNLKAKQRAWGKFILTE